MMMISNKWIALIGGALLVGGIGCGDDDPAPSTNNNNNNTTGTNNDTTGTNNDTTGTNNDTTGTNNDTTVAQTARLQVIHNSPDPEAETVDVYVNGEMFLDDFEYLNATPFQDVPAGVELSVAVAPGTSESVADALATFEYTLEADSSTILVAGGVLDPSAFDSIPDGQGAFNLFAIANAEETATGGARAAVFHGGVDAPAVDIRLNNDPNAVPVEGAAFGDATAYLDLPAGELILLDVLVSESGARAASFQALVPEVAAVVAASGFIAGGDEVPGFGLYAFLASGGQAIPLPQAARAQVIHNAADPSAAVVDVYINGDLALDDFAFRNASPFITVPSSADIPVSVEGGDSTEAGEAVATVNFEAGSTNVIIANGVLDTEDFEANPSGEDIAFGLWVKTDAREAALDPNKVEFFAVHGGTDAPNVDIRAGLDVLLGDIKYGDISDYLAIDPASYILNVTQAGVQGVVAHSATLDATTLGGAALTVLASGFLTPSANNDGEEFRLVAYPATGGPAIVLPENL
jgi:hypothetical protein